MTAEWITKAAAEAYPEDPIWNSPYDNDHELKREGFIAGVELGLAKSAEAAEAFDWRSSGPPICQDCAYVAAEVIAGTIRAFGSDENEEEN